MHGVRRRRWIAARDEDTTQVEARQGNASVARIAGSSPAAALALFTVGDVYASL